MPAAQPTAPGFMTVGQLRAALADCPDNTHIVISHPMEDADGYTIAATEVTHVDTISDDGSPYPSDFVVLVAALPAALAAEYTVRRTVPHDWAVSA